MKKGKKMNKIAIIIIVVIILVLIVSIVVFAKTRPREIATENMEFERQQIQIAVGGGEKETTMENKDYIENQVVAVAESKREAKKIAKQIDGELLSYDNQVAIIQIGITVEEMMQKLEEDSSLPKVYPNYQNYSSN